MLDEQRVMWLIGGGGSGLPLPLAFSTVVEEIIDNDYASFEVLQKRLESVLGFKEDRVLASPFRTWAGFTEGIVDQLESISVIQELGGAWFTDKGFQSGIRITAIPGTDVWFQVWTREDRERRDRAERKLMKVRQVIAEFDQLGQYRDVGDERAQRKLDQALELLQAADKIFAASRVVEVFPESSPKIGRPVKDRPNMPRPTSREVAALKYGFGGTPVAQQVKPENVFGTDGRRVCPGCDHPRFPEDFEVYTDGKGKAWFLRSKCRLCMTKYKREYLQSGA
jgi:hypothetical protein